MTDAPERIWIEDEHGEGDPDQWTYGTWDCRQGTYGPWDCRQVYGYVHEYVRADVAEAAVKAEREACAQLAEPILPAYDEHQASWVLRDHIATTIRTRSET